MAIYSPLNGDFQEIRLLELQAAEEPGLPLRGILRHVWLVSSPSQSPLKYETLSYVWGEPEFNKSIIVADQALPITSRLERILTMLRYKSKSRILWIDSICIDQSNMHERSQQILLMRRVYSQGQRNIAYINADYSLRAHRSPQNIQKGMEIMNKISARDNATLASFRKENEWLLERDENRDFWHNKDSDLIVQEMALSTKVTLICEDTEVDWDIISSFLRDEPYFDAFHVHQDGRFSKFIRKDLFKKIFSNVKFFQDQRNVTRQALTTQCQDEREGSDLLDVLARFRGMKSTDPRDKVFGLLGLVLMPHYVEIDYSKTVVQVYKQTTLSIIECSGHLDIICQSPFELKYPNCHGKDIDQRSSWVPDFGLPQRKSLSVLFAQRDIFNAGLKTLDTPCTVAGGQNDILVLKGVILDRVGQVLRPSPQEIQKCPWAMKSICGSAKHILALHFGTNGFEDMQNQLYLPKIATKSPRVEPAETLIRAYWRTLARDCAAPPNMRRLHKSEMETLDAVNTELLTRGYYLQTLLGDTDEYSGQSGLRFDPRNHSPNISASSKPLTNIPHSLDDYLFNVSNNGLFMMVRPHAEKGDVIVTLDGGKVPMILREQGSHLIDDDLGTHYRIVGPAYVHGFMDGEADEAVAAGLLEKRNLLIS
ncbi:uncharacterized protein EAF01_008868 [Botrytis porri]|uniref:uncharacterized protein n=1 Tax=Botrytis porri TaxID=87229 RepID=UPI001901EDD7|nr:uncharacterized protein EAF01_008868 [Botrytis porri]KAF7897902.1 hypothetical protein EAF01_008868 [Botrytis porri]